MSWPDAVVAVVGIVGFTTILVVGRVTSIQYTPKSSSDDARRPGYFWESTTYGPKPAAPDSQNGDPGERRPGGEDRSNEKRSGSVG